MMNETTATGINLKVGDRVTRKGILGPRGTVQAIRIETVRSSIRQKKDGEQAPGVNVSVIWDNGTVSHFVPESLEKI